MTNHLDEMEALRKEREAEPELYKRIRKHVSFVRRATNCLDIHAYPHAINMAMTEELGRIADGLARKEKGDE